MRFEGSFPAVPVAVSAIRKSMVAFARQCGLDERGLGGVALAVSEAATNALMHGYREDRGTIQVRAEARNGELRIVVADEGHGMAPRPDSPGLGLGLGIIASVAKRMEVVSEGDGTQVHMVFPCPSPPAPQPDERADP